MYAPGSYGPSDAAAELLMRAVQRRQPDALAELSEIEDCGQYDLNRVKFVPSSN